MTPSERALARVTSLIRETMSLRGVRYCDLSVSGQTLARSLKRPGAIKLSTLVHIADLLGCDVVINFRERPAKGATDGQNRPL